MELFGEVDVAIGIDGDNANAGLDVNHHVLPVFAVRSDDLIKC